MANLTKTTTDHDTIRTWAESRGGKPAHVAETGDSDDPGLIKIMFGNTDNLEPIDWDRFFEKFDDNDLAMIYQEKTADGERSKFYKLVNRSTAENAGRD